MTRFATHTPGQSVLAPPRISGPSRAPRSGAARLTALPRRAGWTKRSGCSAFTLLELILASAITAVLMLALYSAMRTGFKARDQAAGIMGSARSAELAMEIVRGDLESAMPPKGVLSIAFLGQAGLEMQGTTAVEFYALPQQISPVENDPTTFGSVGRVQLLVRPSKTGGGELVRQVSQNLLAPAELPPSEEVLCRNVSAFTMRFYDGSQWHEEWDSSQFDDTLPMAVEVVLALAPPNVAPYGITRTFFLPCRDEAALLTGGVQ